MILSIDLGSTSFKAAVIDRDLRVCGLCVRPIRHCLATGGKVELEVGEAVSTLRKAIREAVAAAGSRAAAVQAVAVTSQAQTFTLIDKKGQPRMPFISWQDTRAVETRERMKRAASMRDFDRHCSFGLMLAALQICQIRHLQETRKGLIQPGDLVLNLPTFFVRQWTGAAIVDENIAAMSGMYSLALHDWWPAALRICGLLKTQMPALRPIGGIAALTHAGAAKYGLPRGVPVVLAGNDQTAGGYAAKLDENHGLLLTLGTAQVAYAFQDRMPRPDPGLFRGPFPHGGFYRMAADGCGGSVINWAETILAGCGTPEQFFRQAAKAQPGCHGLLFGADCDIAQGAWNNIGLHHTSADLARSVVESLSWRMVQMIRNLGVRSDKTRVLVAGGGSKSPVWNWILSDALGTKVTVAQGDPYLGAARMAWKAI